MAGTWTAAPLQPFSLNATPTTGVFNAAAPSSWGYASSGTSTIASPTAWGTAPNAVAVPNVSGGIFLWYYCGAVAAGVVQVLVGQQIAGGQILPATTAMSITASSSGWIGPLSPASYNIQTVTNVQASSIVTGSMPAAYAGCFVVSFTTTTNLLVAAFSFANVQP